MSRKYFGTDGIRGKVGDAPITPDFVMRLGYAAGQVLAGAGGANKASTANIHMSAAESADKTGRLHAFDGTVRPSVLIGKDTRISGYMLESALEAGLSAAGVDVLLVGPMPTPAVAHLTHALRLSAGVMISASHNPFEDNGIKFFSGTGAKLPDSVELAIEAALETPMVCVPSARLGKARRVNDAAGRYIEFCKSSFPANLNLRGLKLVVDCAHGATYHIAPVVFSELGAEVIAIGAQPDGININHEVGATHTAAMQKAVITHGADFGIALDGDGDRLMMADRDGEIFDGDRLLYAIVKDRAQRGVLKGGVVGTLMTNFALEQLFAKQNIPFARANVGDRYVLEMLREKGWEMGGENSGHLLCLDKHSTGDGIISALQVLAALSNQDESLANTPTLGQFTSELRMFPQVMINVRLTAAVLAQSGGKISLKGKPQVDAAVAAAEKSLAGDGRVLLRASGTEPLIRVMVEGRDGVKVTALANSIADVVREAYAA
jgi:phosphoglucosamine mutase